MTSTPGTPDFLEIDLGSVPSSVFPLDVKARIALNEVAYAEIHRHASENTSLELCGVLIGNLFKDGIGPFLKVTNIIRGEYAENKGTQVTFSHKTWEFINNEKDAKFADEQIIGWYHTHPRFGIFLSEADQFIHASFFNQPWQIAFVVDPVQNQEGVFIWKKGVPLPVSGFWVGDKRITGAYANETNSIKSEHTPEISATTETGNKKKVLLLSLVLIVIAMAVFCVVAGLKIYSLNKIVHQRNASLLLRSYEDLGKWELFENEDREYSHTIDTLQRGIEPHAP